MPGVINVNSIEELYRFLNDKNVMEIAIRGKNQKFKAFQKVALNNLQQSEANAVQQAVALLNKSNAINAKNLQMLSNLTKLTQFTMVLSGLNLFATVAGFAIMNDKINKMSKKIDQVISTQKEIFGIQTVYEINKVVSEYSNMMDCRKTGEYYTEGQLRKLVSDEWNALEMLITIFKKDVTCNQEEFFFTMVSMASMLSATLRYFDELYYFNHRDVIQDGDVWHNDHNKWMSSIENMMKKEFIERVQDFGIFALDLNTVENDCFYTNYTDQIQALKQDVTDNQKMIEVLNDPELFGLYVNTIKEDAENEIENALQEVGVDPTQFNKEIRVAVA